MTELRKTYERVASLIGAKFDEAPVCHKSFDNDYFIFISEVNQKNVHIGLVQDMHTGRGFDNVRIEQLTIKVGASDKVIMNRYNKLIEAFNEIVEKA